MLFRDFGTRIRQIGLISELDRVPGILGGFCCRIHSGAGPILPPENGRSWGGLHGPFLANGNHSPVHLSGTWEDDRGDSGQAQGKVGLGDYLDT